MPRPATLLSRPAAVAVALLLVGAMGRVPLELLGLVGQHHLHRLQRPGDGAFLQRTSFLGKNRAQVTNYLAHSYQEKTCQGWGDPGILGGSEKQGAFSHQF